MWLKSVCLFLFLLSTGIKVLLIPSYHSTDFEVHRNWMAITFNSAPSKWYYEASSQWTLDYPPFFAWFERTLSYIAHYSGANENGRILAISPEGYFSTTTLLFQRFTVIVSDIVLYTSLYIHSRYSWQSNLLHMKARIDRRDSDSTHVVNKSVLFVFLSCMDVGLLMVDHVHFQYNGFLLGIFILSLTCMENNRELWGAFFYSVLLMFKHIYLYVAPLYFVYLLRHFCFLEEGHKWRFSIIRLVQLGSIVLSVFGIGFFSVFPWQEWDFFSISSFIALCFETAQQLAKRLFPVQRGLCHAYWAPNLWALYAAADTITSFALKTLGSGLAPPEAAASMTSGLVDDKVSFKVFPSIAPIVTALLSLATMTPLFIKIWSSRLNTTRPGSRSSSARTVFLHGVVYCMFCSYMCGYHVHEKAVLQILIPLSLFGLDSVHETRLYFLMQVVSTLSLLPLLFSPMEVITRYVLFAFFQLASFISLSCFTLDQLRRRKISCNSSNALLLSSKETTYLLFLVVIQVIVIFISLPFRVSMQIQAKLPFLSLLLQSTSLAFGMVYLWHSSWKVLCRKFDQVQDVHVEQTHHNTRRSREKV